MRWLISIGIALAACGSDEPTGKTSHLAMPNQFEVGSTLGGTYRVVKKLGDTGEYSVFAVEHERMADRALTLIAARTPAASRPLHDAAAREKALTIVDVKRTPDERVY